MTGGRAPTLRPAPFRGSAGGLSFLRWPGDPSRATVVLLHGIGSQAESWQGLAAALDRDLDVIAWDAPGYGGSRTIDHPRPRPIHYARALDTMLTALDIGRIVLVGHSLGCLFAARFAAAPNHWDRVAAIGLLSPALGYGIEAEAPLPAGVQARIDDLDRLGPDAFAATRASRLVFEPETKPDLVARVRSGMAAVRQPGYGQAVWALGAGDLAADVAPLAAPVLVGVGREDVVTPPGGARGLHALVRRSLGFHEIDGVGHALPQEAPAEAARLVELLMEEADHGN